MKKEEIYFPTCRYHKEQGDRVFQNQEELDTADKGWVDSPAKFKGKAKKDKEVPPEESVDNKKEESVSNPLNETNRFPGEKEYTTDEVANLKKRAKELHIQGFGIMKPATLEKRVAEAEEAIKKTKDAGE